MIELPTERLPAEETSPRRLIIYSMPKVGKTTLVAELDNCLLIDTENGSTEVSAMKVRVNSIDEYFQVLKSVQEKGNPYRYIAIDTITTLETFCLKLALMLYKQTPLGKTFTGTNILHLPNGGGYLYLREAFDLAIEEAQKSCQRLILLGHLRDKLIEKQGKEMSSYDLDLTGKLKTIACAAASAIGFLYREPDGVYITFNNTKGEVAAGSRPKHLKNQTFLMSQEEDGKIITHWDKIYID